MFKYTRWGLRVFFPLVYAYFAWMRRYARHPERYTLEVRYAKVREFVFKIAKILRLDVEVSNKPKLEHGKTYYYVANHTSLVDAIVTVMLFDEPVRFIVKNEARKMPVVRHLTKILECVYLERDNLKQEIRAMQTTRKSLANKESSWMVFPEGTRNKVYQNDVAEYKAGAFKAPLQTNTPIVPFVLWGTQVVLPLRTRAKRFPIFAEFLEPVMHYNDETTNDLATAIYSATNKTMNELRTKYQTVAKLNKFGQKFIKLQ